jgi:CTP synthase
VNELRRIGIHPDVVVCRSHEELSRDIRDKIALFADVDPGAVVASPDVPDVYEVPRVLEREGPRSARGRAARLELGEPDLSDWDELLERMHSRREVVEIALVGKYVKLQDAYPLRPRSAQARRARARLRRPRALGGRRGHVLRRGGRAARERRRRARARRLRLARWEGKILACQVARERRIPYLGICLGMHVAVSEFARHVVGLEGANSTGDGSRDAVSVIDLLPEQKGIEDLGGTMRLGAQAVEVAEGTRARELYGDDTIHERHRHRYEVNNTFRDRLVEAGPRRERDVPGGPARGDRRAPGPSLVRREPVPPGVQVPADAVGSALPRLRRRGARPRAVAAGRARRSLTPRP